MAAEPTPTSPAIEALHRWRFADITLDERTLELRVRGVVVPLNRKPLKVLIHLLQHTGEVVTKDELAEACWPRRILSDTVLTTTINRLRAALGDENQELIKTVHGFGYRLSAQVSVELLVDQLSPRLELKPGEHPPLRPMWTLVRRLGIGGSGEVWLATHDKTSEQRVFKFAADATALKGLKREITLFRLLKQSLGERRDLVRFIDWNLEQPPCYIETEFVVAGSLADWTQARGGCSVVPLAQRIELIAQCGETLALAHGVGVLHKDLKPSNVLIVDEGGVPYIKLADFGSGGILDADGLAKLGITRMGFTVTRALRDTTSGTPLYFPPEIQLGQPATVQGDIYALGVMLYQAIVGDWKKPLAPGWEREIDDELLREDIAHAVDGDASRRLADAAEFARRLRSLPQRRIERDKIKQARLEQAALQEHVKQSQLRRKYSRIAIAVLAVGLIAIGVLYAQLLGAQRQREAALADAREEAAIAQQASDYVVSLFDAASPEKTGGKPIIARKLVDQGQAEIERRFSDRPRVRAHMLATVGSLYCKLGLPAECAKDAEEGLAIEKNDALLRAQLQYWLGLARHAQGNFAGAEESLRVAVSEYEKQFPQADAHLNDARLALGNALLQQHKDTESIAVLERARAALQDEKGVDSPSASSVLGVLALAYQDANRQDDAAKLAAQGIALIKKSLGPDSLDYVTALEQFANTLGNIDRDVDAVNAFREVVAGYTKILGKDNQKTLNAETDFAVTLMAIGHFNEAAEVAREALDGYRRLEGEKSENYEQASLRLGRILFYRGDYAAAVPYLRTAYQGIESRHGSKHLMTLSAGFDLARPLIYLGQTREALSLLDHEIPADLESGFAKYMRAMRKRWLAECNLEQGRLVQANELFEAAAKDFQTFKAPDTASLVKLHESQGRLLIAEHKYEDAVTMLQQVIVDYRRLYPDDSAYLQTAEVELADAIVAIGKQDEAHALIAKAGPILKHELAPTSRTIVLLKRLQSS